jgi:hypothetical protein
MDIYTRLFKYRDTPSGSPLENFLTEALADMFNRFPVPLKIGFLVSLLPASCSSRLRSKCKDDQKIEARTQVSILAAGSFKRPDIIVYIDDKPLVLFEVKVDAAVQKHELRSPEVERTQGAKSDFIFQSQLKTYSEWIGSKSGGDWSGAVVFLTHGTPAPEEFENDGSESDSVIGVTRTWKDVGNWLADNLDLNKLESTPSALALDFNRFLEGQGLMTNFMTSRDVAATALFMPAYPALTHTFKTVISSVASKYPQSKGGNVHVEFWPTGNSYYSWYYLNNKLTPPKTRFYIAIGICFPDQGALESDNPVGVPKHEPFFFVFLADEYENMKTSKLLSKIPDGWVTINEDYDLVIASPVSHFDADPDIRVQALIEWAQEQVGRAVACIPNFETAPVQNIPAEED